MIPGSLLFILLFLVPVLGIAACLLPLGSRPLLRINVTVALTLGIVTGALYTVVPLDGRIFMFGEILFIDILSLYHLTLVAVIFLLSSVFSLSHFSPEIDRGGFNSTKARRFCMIWNGFLLTLIGVLCSNNMGLMWVFLEATTLVSALLIMTNRKASSIEAMWKYLILCSVGIAFAFVGTLLLSVAADQTLILAGESLHWTSLSERAASLNGTVMCVAFIFVLVGFGTKAGLAPMHTWLPDAHSQAPTPVSAVLSGIMLNCAFYCIMRYLPLCEASMNWNGRAHSMLLIFGILSLIIAAVFVPSQKNVKRMLAYCSVEHIGIIALGVGIGGLGTFAALFHTLNHSLSKSLAFFSAGRLARQYGTYDMTIIKGAQRANPLWGTTMFIAILALFGAAPFSIFMSEVQMVKAAVDGGHYTVLVLFLVCAIIVFVNAIRRAITMCMGQVPAGIGKPRWYVRDYIIAMLLSAAIFTGGLVMPDWYADILRSSAALVDGQFTGRVANLFAGGIQQ